ERGRAVLAHDELARVDRSAPAGGRGLDREEDREVADGDEIAGLEDALGDVLAVEDGAVGAAQVADPPAAEGVAEDLGVAARDGVVIERELEVRRAAEHDVGLVELVPDRWAVAHADLEERLWRRAPWGAYGLTRAHGSMPWKRGAPSWDHDGIA